MRARLFGALALATQVAFMVPSAAHARADYDRSDPAAGATVPTPPSAVTVWFTQELAPDGSSLEVRDAGNTRVDAGDSRVVQGPPRNSMMIGLKPGLPAGTYTVVWKTRSADDNQEANGVFAFSVGVPAPAPAAATGADTQTPSGPFLRHDRIGSFDVTGTVVSLQGNTMEFVTSDVTGQPIVIKLDASEISRRNISKNESMTLTIGPRENKIPLIWAVVNAGSFTEGADFSPNQDASSNETSNVQNRPDDDEARNKQKHEKGKDEGDD